MAQSLKFGNNQNGTPPQGILGYIEPAKIYLFISNKVQKMQQYERCQRLIYNKLKYNQSPEAALEVWHP